MLQRGRTPDKCDLTPLVMAEIGVQYGLQSATSAGGEGSWMS